MFTDIAGYTAMMQENEAKAVEIRTRHREVFERQHEQHRGQIIQYYGDGTLSIFDSAVDAAACAVAMQLEFQKGVKVPLRIGIHTGDIMVNETEVIGDGVNVASRVESLAIPGSVLVSENLFDNIKNQEEFTGRSLGVFTFKNVAKPLEVFALSWEGLEVPNPKKLTGKYIKRESREKDWFQRQPIWLKYVAGFIVFLALAPFIYSPITSLFNADASPNMVEFEDENGNMISRMVIPEADRKTLYLSTLENISGDSTIDWATTGLPYAMELDFDQDPYTLNMYNEGEEVLPLPELIAAAKKNNSNVLIKGQLDRNDSTYKATITLYQIPSGKVIQTIEEESPELLLLGDQLTYAVKMAIGIPADHLETFTDLSIKSVMTESEEAYKDFCLGMLAVKVQSPELFQRFSAASETDPTFAWANFYYANLLFYYQRSETLVKQYLDLSMDHMGRLPEIFSVQIKKLDYKVNDQPEKALKLAELMTQLEPGKSSHWTSLINESFSQQQYDQTLKAIDQYMKLQPGSDAMLMTKANCHLWLNQPTEGLSIINQYLATQPKDQFGLLIKGQLLLLDENPEEAREVFERGSFIHNENDIFSRMVKHCDFVLENGSMSEETGKKYEGQYWVQSLSQFKIKIHYDLNTIIFQAGDQPSFPIYQYDEEHFAMTYDALMRFPVDSITGDIKGLSMIQNDNPLFSAFHVNGMTMDIVETFKEGNLEKTLELINSTDENQPNKVYFEWLKSHIENYATGINQENWPNYVGQFNYQGQKMDVELREEGLYLVLPENSQAIEPNRLFQCDEDKFLIISSLNSAVIIETKGNSPTRIGFHNTKMDSTMYGEVIQD